jgi:hypothetical protein
MAHRDEISGTVVGSQSSVAIEDALSRHYFRCLSLDPPNISEFDGVSPGQQTI